MREPAARPVVVASADAAMTVPRAAGATLEAYAGLERDREPRGEGALR